MKRIVLITLCLVTAAWLCRYVLTYGDAKWLRIESRSNAITGQPFDIRITLPASRVRGYLGVDLHRLDDNKTYRGYLSSAGTKRIIPGENVYDFSAPVPSRANPWHVIPIVFISTDGTWRNRVIAANGDPVPVSRASGETGTSRKTLSAHDIESPLRGGDSGRLRILIAALWLAVFTALSAGGVPGGKVFAILSLVAAAWEGMNAGAFLTGLVRGMALYSGYYGERRIPQQMVTVLGIFAAVSLLLYLTTSMRRKERLPLAMTMTAFWAVELLGILSLHEADMLLSEPVAGVNAGQMLRLISVLLCLGVVVFMNLRGRIAAPEKKVR